jgi:NAD(P) transhydrogenase
MIERPDRFDVVVLGAGPAGQKAAIQAAKAGTRVLIVERSVAVGGECVRHGTLPSKTLRETAAFLSGLRARSGGLIDPGLTPGMKLESLMQRQAEVRREHERCIADQLERNAVRVWRGSARFLSPNRLEVRNLDGTRRQAEAQVVILATGSRPRTPPDVPVDHENILDSDSILSLIYLPTSLTVLGCGVTASEFASTFAALGVRVTMIASAERPVGFMDRELTDIYVSEFERQGGRFLGGRRVESVQTEGVGEVVAVLDGGEEVRSEKMLCALGRVVETEGLGLAAAGLQIDEAGTIPVDSNYRTAVPGIYAVGDVVGPPSLAAAAMEQGRRAARHALGLPVDDRSDAIPVGIHTLPEMASVGLGEMEAVERYGSVMVGRARFAELARGQICGDGRGLLKLIAHPSGGRVLGVHIVGQDAAELVHVGQMAVVGRLGFEVFIENVLNFPTLAEAYRVAALDAASRRRATLLRAA